MKNLELYIPIVSVIVLIAAAVLFYRWRIRAGKNHRRQVHDASDLIVSTPEMILNPNTVSDLLVQFELLPTLTEREESSLVEIKDQGLLARITQVIPGALQVAANIGEAHRYQNAAKRAGTLYQAIIPNGAVLANSKEMPGAFRGFFLDADGIEGHANLIPVNGDIGDGIELTNIANAAMGVAAMVVGQYYMTRINNQLEEINDELNRIASYQDNEYKSRIYTLIAEVQKCSQFRMIIIENEELRKRELDHLKELEHECSQLLDQANITLGEFSKKKGLDYASYEKLVGDAHTWYLSQQVLLKTLQQIEELTYVLNFGDAPREYCYALYQICLTRTNDVMTAIKTWHYETCAALEIDLDSLKRRRKGLLGLVLKPLALINNNIQYQVIPNRTAFMISTQCSENASSSSYTGLNLFHEDVRLISKDGKIFYLPKEAHE